VQRFSAVAAQLAASACQSAPGIAIDFSPRSLPAKEVAFTVLIQFFGIQAFLMEPLFHPAPRRTLVNSRLRKHSDYSQAYAAGRKHQSTSMSWFLAPQRKEPARPLTAGRVGLTTGRVLGKAHERNRIKRRMREALRRHVDLLPAGFDLIFHPRRDVLDADFVQLEAEIVRILKIAGNEPARGAKLAAAEPASLAKPAS
jgi:ribonuclease P protein component